MSQFRYALQPCGSSLNVRIATGRGVAWLVVTILLGRLLVPASFATGPTLPVEFVDAREVKDAWAIALRLDPNEMRVVRAERSVYLSGEQLWIEPIQIDFEKQAGDEPARLIARVPLRSKRMEEMRQRAAFAEKVAVDGQWLNQSSARPLHVEQWFYFVLRGDKLERIDLDAYTYLTDPVQVTINSWGKRALVSSGKDLKADVPLPRTRSTPALPIGRLGGAAKEQVSKEEQVPKKGQAESREADRSEAEEK